MADYQFIKMKNTVLLSIVIIFLCAAFTPVQDNTDTFKFRVDSAKINGSQWATPYRFDNKELKSVSVKLIIQSNKNQVIDLNFLSLVDDDNKLRLRPTGVYYLRANDKRKYLKTKPLNENYNAFEENTMKDYENLQAKTFKPNFFGRKKKKEIASVKTLKKVRVKDKVTYYIDFPVKESFTNGKVYYKNKSIGFAAVKN